MDCVHARSPVDEDGMPVVVLHDGSGSGTPMKAHAKTVVAAESSSAPSEGSALAESHVHPRSAVGEAMAATAAAAAAAADATAPTVMSDYKRLEVKERLRESEPMLIEVSPRFAGKI